MLCHGVPRMAVRNLTLAILALRFKFTPGGRGDNVHYMPDLRE